MLSRPANLLLLSLILLSSGILSSGIAATAPAAPAKSGRFYLGFDKNTYPGDDLLPALHQTFSFTGYWLNNPPGAASNPWVGRRATLRSAGFGFLILFNGRTDAELRGHDAASLGKADADAAVDAALREGFPAGATIYLDQEEGGRLLPEQADYLGAWITWVSYSDFHPGVYCSGIRVRDGKDVITTAGDIAQRFPDPDLELHFWVLNDQTPPSPGCTPLRLNPSKSGFPAASVWQYARSPRGSEPDTSAKGYAPGNLCYAPGLPHSEHTFLDLDTSRSPDPSQGR
ncbi:DUF1906 domain-containing protein [Acidipila sp. 4G-K13]|uniref:DUF1906 domain-containing protein n=2 Tax=Paracidobacterium acidisoli TaxID=2303751 RepID=A0A372IQP4_9BACT|nr:glycoside hydrolase domain-containing protein [Paracidobacterium acidisoli]MBT9331309.1 DUF1906 domain-containing protein [Paracidobacterium acidisoli]